MILIPQFGKGGAIFICSKSRCIGYSLLTPPTQIDFSPKSLPFECNLDRNHYLVTGCFFSSSIFLFNSAKYKSSSTGISTSFPNQLDK